MNREIVKGFISNDLDKIAHDFVAEIKDGTQKRMILSSGEDLSLSQEADIVIRILSDKESEKAWLNDFLSD